MPTRVDGTTDSNATINHAEPPASVRAVQAITKVTSDKYVPAPSLDELEIENAQMLRDFRRRVRLRASAVGLIEKEDKRKHPKTRNRSDDDSGDYFEEREDVSTDTREPSLRTGLYDKVSPFADEKSDHKRTEKFLSEVGDTLTRRLLKLHSHRDLREVSDFDLKLAEQLNFMRKEKDWVLVPTDKTNSWVPCRLDNYVGWVRTHLDRYCHEIPYARLKEIKKDCYGLLDKYSHLMDEGEENFVKACIDSPSSLYRANWGWQNAVCGPTFLKI